MEYGGKVRKTSESRKRENARQQEQRSLDIPKGFEEIFEKFADPKKKLPSPDERKALLARVRESSARLNAKGYYFDEETGLVGKREIP